MDRPHPVIPTGAKRSERSGGTLRSGESQCFGDKRSLASKKKNACGLRALIVSKILRIHIVQQPNAAGDFFHRQYQLVLGE
jgi:hypothetical protein